MLTVTGLSLPEQLLLAGQTVRASLTLFSDVADTVSVTLYVLGYGQVTFRAGSPAGGSVSGAGSLSSPVAVTWTTQFAAGATQNYTITFTVGAEPFVWQGAVVAEVVGAANTTGAAVGFVVGPSSLEAPQPPVPSYSFDSFVQVAQLIAPYRVEVGQDIVVTCSGQTPFNPNLGPSGDTITSLTLTGGPATTLVSATGDVYGPVGSGVEGLIAIDGPNISATWTASTVGILTATGYVGGTPISALIGVGTNPPVQPAPAPYGGGTGSGGGTSGGGSTSGGLSGFLRRNLGWLLPLSGGLVGAVEFGIGAHQRYLHRAGRPPTPRRR